MTVTTQCWIELLDTKLSCRGDAVKLLEDLDMLSEWSARWLLKFNPLKCKLMHLRHNMDTKYHITQDNQEWNIQSVQQEKDLGVLTSSDLAVSHQCMEAASRANPSPGNGETAIQGVG